MAVDAAYPFVVVEIKPPPAPIVQRAPGVIAIVGATAAGDAGGEAEPNAPMVGDTADMAVQLFAQTVNDVDQDTPLSRSLKLAMLQGPPKPSKIYGVRVDSEGTPPVPSYAQGLAALEGIDDVTFVALAEESRVDQLLHLKTHVEEMSSAGVRRLGVAMIDPAIPKSITYVQDVVDGREADPTAEPPITAIAGVDPDAGGGLRSSSSRMVLVAARGAKNENAPSAIGDAASAAMAAMAGLPPHVSLVLKSVKGITMPSASQYSPTEIVGLSVEGIIPIIDPALISGSGLYFAEGRCFTSNEQLLFVDIVRTLDQIEFDLKAGLIGLVGDARITRAGMTRLKARVEGILGVHRRNAVIDAFTIDIPVLNILDIPESARSADENQTVTTARENRAVDLFLSVTYGPAVHRLHVTLEVKF